ncbi:MAG: CPXCG motif-containing cysteine-rich protein [Gammaproteobacteria bacterium]|nr:CPXCG motif-containing cysteine-rich protein [Gammaproteobacteria bacterium]
MNRWLTEHEISCPFCAETITILVDASAGSQDYIEDCQVCCRPIQMTIGVDGDDIRSVQVDCAS